MIPADLTVHPRWLVWRSEQRDGKWTKVPVNARTGAPAKSTDPETWSTFEEATCAYERGRWDGVGIALVEPFVGIDLDDVVDPSSGEIHPDALHIIRELNSYTELSPSGRGLRIFTKGTLPEGWRSTSKWVFKIEVYNTARYLTVTGHHLAGTATTIEERAAELGALHARVAAAINTSMPITGNGHHPAGVDHGDDELLAHARRAKNGDKFRRLFDRGIEPDEDHSAADLALCDMLAFWTRGNPASVDRLFRRSALMRRKWDERHAADGRTYGQLTLARAADASREIYTPVGASFEGGHEQAAREAREPSPNPAPALRAPHDAMIGLGRDFAELFSRYLEPPFAFFYFLFLAQFGALVAKKITLDSELRPEPRLYVVLIGESADTRKSTAVRKTTDFFRSLGSRWEPRILFGVGSAEGVAAELKESPDLLLVFDELKQFVDKAKHEGSVVLPMVTTLFEGADYDNRTKTERVSVRGASLSLIAACTNETYATMFDQRFFAIGFLNRLWLVADRTTASIPVPQLIPDADLGGLRRLVAARLEAIDKAYAGAGLRPVPYAMTPGARRVFEAWYGNRTGSLFERRLDTFGHRLMVLLAATCGKTSIDEEVAEAVVTLLRYQLDVRRESDPVDAENTIAALEEKIRRVLARGALKGRDLKRRCSYHRFGLWAWNTAVSNLIHAGELLHDRATDTFWLDPAVSSIVSRGPRD